MPSLANSTAETMASPFRICNFIVLFRPSGSFKKKNDQFFMVHLKNPPGFMDV